MNAVTETPIDLLPPDAPADTAPLTPLAARATHRENPSAVASLLELIKPRMNLLILGTTAVGYVAASVGPIQVMRLLDTLIGTALCAAAAAILNQFIERRYDALMERTRNRPLPTGRVAPGTALAMGVTAGVLGVAWLLRFVNPLTAVLGAATLLSYVLVYTPLKRKTTLNTVVGAAPGAIPPLMGWTAVTGSISAAGLSLFAILFVWQIPHFLAIAILYRDDYRRGGFKMLPVEDDTLAATSRQIVLYAASLLPASLWAAITHVAGPVYAVAAVVLGLAFFGFALQCAATRQRVDARRLFFASIIYLPVLLTVLMLDRP